MKSKEFKRQNDFYEEYLEKIKEKVADFDNEMFSLFNKKYLDSVEYEGKNDDMHTKIMHFQRELINIADENIKFRLKLNKNPLGSKKETFTGYIKNLIIEDAKRNNKIMRILKKKYSKSTLKKQKLKNLDELENNEYPGILPTGLLPTRKSIKVYGGTK